jgi:hypothetical protein
MAAKPKKGTKLKKGQFAPGVSGNPAGRKPGNQDFITRAKYWLETKTAQEIIDLARNAKEMMALSVYDHMIIKRLVKALGADGEGTMERLLDRVLGRPTQQLNVESNVHADITVEQHFTVSELDSWLADIGGSPAKADNKASLPH